MVILQLDWFPSPAGTDTVERTASGLDGKARCWKRNRNGCHSSACQDNEWTTKPWIIWLKFFSRSPFCIFAFSTVLLWLLSMHGPDLWGNLIIHEFVFSPYSFEHQLWELEGEESWELRRIPREGNKLVLSSLYTPTRTEGYINEEIKGEWVVLAQHRITCSWKVTIFGWFLE